VRISLIALSALFSPILIPLLLAYVLVCYAYSKCLEFEIMRSRLNHVGQATAEFRSSLSARDP
jgi:hypothetical protein